MWTYQCRLQLVFKCSSWVEVPLIKYVLAYIEKELFNGHSSGSSFVQKVPDLNQLELIVCDNFDFLKEWMRGECWWVDDWFGLRVVFSQERQSGPAPDKEEKKQKIVNNCPETKEGPSPDCLPDTHSCIERTVGFVQAWGALTWHCLWHLVRQSRHS